MTPKQEQAVKLIRERFAPREGYEIKRDEIVTPEYGTVWLYFETGLIGDEGTMASVFARDSRAFSIGKRGAIKSMNKAGQMASGMYNTRR